MELKEQRYVVTLADCRSLTKAAEQLYISQPALSIYISNLEKNIGLPLFDREGKKFVPTLAGEHYLAHARKILSEGQTFDQEISNMLSDKAGRIRFGISLMRSNYLLPTVLKKFRAAWPQVKLVIRQGNTAFLNDLMRRHELDMELVNEAAPNPQMGRTELFEEELIVAVPPGHPLNGRAVYKPGLPYGILSPRDLNGQVFLSTTESHSTRRLQDQLMEKYKIIPGRVETIRSEQLNLQLVAEGMGITLIRESYTKFFRYHKPVHLYMLDIPEHRRTVAVIYPRRTVIPKYMEELLSMLRQRGLEILSGRV